MLCKLGLKYGTDKVPEIFHSYTPFYSQLWSEKRKEIKRLFEIGIAGGASLRMWQDYFPNAEIYAIDNSEKTLINEGRIHSFKCDQGSVSQLKALEEKIGKDFDIIIDDGSHYTEHQIMTAKALLPLLKKGGIYVIEDVHEAEMILKEFPDAIYQEFEKKPGFYQDNNLIIINA